MSSEPSVTPCTVTPSTVTPMVPNIDGPNNDDFGDRLSVGPHSKRADIDFLDEGSWQSSLRKSTGQYIYCPSLQKAWREYSSDGYHGGCMPLAGVPAGEHPRGEVLFSWVQYPRKQILPRHIRGWCGRGASAHHPHPTLFRMSSGLWQLPRGSSNQKCCEDIMYTHRCGPMKVCFFSRNCSRTSLARPQHTSYLVIENRHSPQL